MLGADSPCPCKPPSLPPSVVHADNSSHLPVKRPRLGGPVSGFLYVPALTAGAPSFIRPPCRFREKQEPDRIYLAAGICGNMPPPRLKQLKFSLLITACSWLS
ncbi:hypothetical protein CXT95_02245 [Akkermansia muciniphila]|uniref:Uncharacterized protein n=1 Tax=Akkermansia muciniphila TaxID=239935 RepID=A0AAX0WNN9_9BACT|nr:hypothetical protein CXT95_02245 [Akkermansia muciniphila]